jgi:HSP20 family protein
MLVRRVWPARPTFESAFGASSNDFDQLRREMLRLLDTAGSDGGVEPAAGVFPPINITQDDENFYLRAEIPGIKPAELSISALRNRVAISGKRQIPLEHDRASYHRKERPEGAFDRAVTLPSEVDAERVDARYTDGVLTVTLPKAEQAKPRQIAVRT